jgi:hypothetical protein
MRDRSWVNRGSEWTEVKNGRNVPAQTRVVRAIHLAHSTAADGLDDLVRTYP